MRHMKSTGFMRRIFVSNALLMGFAHKNARHSVNKRLMMLHTVKPTILYFLIYV